MSRLWKKVTPIPIEFNGYGFLWDCTKCGYCLASLESYPKCDCPRCGATEQTESQRNSEKVKGTPQTESTGSPIGDYRDGVGAWQTDCGWK